MMRSLWTGASGMTAQQLNVDVIANNISNVNTTGYKRERAEFQTLLYQTMQKPAPALDSNIIKPNPMQVGHGVKYSAITRDYQQGSFERTENTYDFALDGIGFFTIQKGDEIVYTKDGAFKLSVNDNSSDLTLVTSDGYPVLDTNNEPILIPEDTEITVNQVGMLIAKTELGAEELGIQIQINQFANSNGLESLGNNLYRESISSGAPVMEVDGDTTTITSINQGFLEMSNVQIADEMVKLIVAQRAYELNSKSITTSDEMLQTANSLKR